MRKGNKVSIIGAGFVGSAITFAIMDSGLASDIVLVDMNKEKAEGEIMDISHGAAFVKSVDMKAGDYPDLTNSDIVIITAGAAQKPGETRLDLINKNAAIFKSIVPQVVKYAPEAIILVVSNPVDVLSFVAYKLSGLPANRVLGSGTVLDSSRLRFALAKEFDLDARNVHAHIVGEHGDSEFPNWSAALIGSMKLADYCQEHDIDLGSLEKRISKQVREYAYRIIEKKGYTNYAIALAVRRIVEAILRDENSVLSVSTLDETGSAYYSVPTVVGKNGKIMSLVPKMNDEEGLKLAESRQILKETIAKINL
ncbi:MAG: L-lactate dehydrogenase [Bacilli bacterium]|jgi:L-lactate dehydrogenase|nr:L-lactate dehydrogenase [Bacilli bacterium]